MMLRPCETFWKKTSRSIRRFEYFQKQVISDVISEAEMLHNRTHDAVT